MPSSIAGMKERGRFPTTVSAKPTNQLPLGSDSIVTRAACRITPMNLNSLNSPFTDMNYRRRGLLLARHPVAGADPREAFAPAGDRVVERFVEYDRHRAADRQNR